MTGCLKADSTEDVNNHGSGYALVLVLIGVALLSLIAESVLMVSSQSIRHTSLDEAKIKLEFAAKAGISQAMLSLVDLRPSQRWPIDGTPRSMTFDGIAVTVTIESEAGKIDLNSANRPLIFGLFQAAGLDQTAANTLTDRVLDWREAGEFKRLNGAKAVDYQVAGSPFRPRLGPFQSIDELNLVLGMTSELYEEIEPDITVYNVVPSPELQSAPRLVLLASGMGAATVESIMSARSRGEVAPAEGITQLNAVSRIPALPSSVFTIIACAHDGQLQITRTDIVRFTGHPNNPYWILALR